MSQSPTSNNYILSPDNIRQIIHKICGTNVNAANEVIFLIQNTIQMNILKITHIAINIAYQRTQKHTTLQQQQQQQQYQLSNAAILVDLPNPPQAQVGKVELTPDDLQSACLLFLEHYIPTLSNNLQSHTYNAQLKRKHHLYNSSLHKLQTKEYILNNNTASDHNHSDMFPTIAIGLAGTYQKTTDIVNTQRIHTYTQQIKQQRKLESQKKSQLQDESIRMQIGWEAQHEIYHENTLRQVKKQKGNDSVQSMNNESNDESML